MNVAKRAGEVTLLYWDRLLSHDIKFNLDKEIAVKRVRLKAPQGRIVIRTFLMLLFCVRALYLIIKEKPSTIHLGNFDMLIIAYIYKRIFNKKVNIVYEVGDLPEITFRSGIVPRTFIKMEKKMLKVVNKIILTSPYFWEFYYQYLTEESKYLFIPNVPYEDIQIEGFKSNYQKNKKLTIGFIGSVRYFEQIKMIIDVAKGNSEIDIIISGTGRNINDLKEYADHSENVVFTGAFNYGDIKHLYNKIDITFCVYDTKKKNVRIALPNRLYESLLFSKPIIVSNNTELAKFVIEKGVGYTVDDNDTEGLSYLINYISNNDKSTKDKANSCKNISHEYVYDNYVEKLLLLYT